MIIYGDLDLVVCREFAPHVKYLTERKLHTSPGQQFCHSRAFS